MNIREKIKEILNEFGFTESLIEHIIEEKLVRYDEIRDKIKNKEIKETSGIIAELTKLEDSIVDSIEKYLKLKHPERYSTRVVHQDNAGLNEEELDKKINELKEIFNST